MLLLSLVLAIEYRAVSNIGNGQSNYCLLFNGEALIINPAFLSNCGFSYSNQQIDVHSREYEQYKYEYFTLSGFAYGSVHYKDKTNSNLYDVNLMGFGMQIKEGIRWGINYQQISMLQGTANYTSWTTKAGFNYLAGFPFKMLIGITMENVIKDAYTPEALDLSPIFGLSIGTIPLENVFFTNAVSYKRKAGETATFSSGLTLMLDKDLAVMCGINNNGYSAGMEVPFGFAKFAKLGKLSYSILMPYDVRQEIRYYFAYTLGTF